MPVRDILNRSKYAATMLVLFFMQAVGWGQVSFVSPFSVVQDSSTVDVYHISVLVSIEVGHISIGLATESAQPFVLRYEVAPVTDGHATTYYTDQGTVIHDTDRAGQSLTWWGGGRVWRLYSFLPAFIQIEK